MSVSDWRRFDTADSLCYRIKLVSSLMYKEVSILIIRYYNLNISPNAFHLNLNLHIQCILEYPYSGHETQQFKAANGLVTNFFFLGKSLVTNITQPFQYCSSARVWQWPNVPLLLSMNDQHTVINSLGWMCFSWTVKQWHTMCTADEYHQIVHVQ